MGTGGSQDVVEGSFAATRCTPEPHRKDGQVAEADAHGKGGLLTQGRRRPAGAAVIPGLTDAASNVQTLGEDQAEAPDPVRKGYRGEEQQTHRTTRRW